MSEGEGKFVEKEENGVYLKSVENITPVSSFKGHLINSRILENMEAMKISSPTLVQKYVVPLGMHGKDLLITAPTGMGKTISFLVPTINYLISLPSQDSHRYRSRFGNKSSSGSAYGSKKDISALILSPTRELTMQIYEDSQKLLKGISLTSSIAYGGTNKSHQVRNITKGTDLLIATPGRALDILSGNNVSISKISVLIFDEADRMLEMGFEKQIRDILGFLDSSRRRQTMMFSATFPLPLQRLAKEFFQKTPCEVHVGHGPLESIKQEFVHIEGFDSGKTKRNEKLLNLLAEYGYTPGEHSIDINTTRKSYSRPSASLNLSWNKKPSASEKKKPSVEEAPKKKENDKPKIVVFVDQKVECRNLAAFLSRKGIECTSLHGDKEQSEREDALYEFKNNISPILIATSVAARGLDIPGIALVINYAMPSDIKEYIHRIGRTGRAGKNGRAVTFITRDDYSHVPALINILKKANQKIPAFLEGLPETRERGGGRSFGGRNVSLHKKKEEDAGTHFYETKEIKHKEPAKIEEEIKIKDDLDWGQEIS